MVEVLAELAGALVLLVVVALQAADFLELVAGVNTGAGQVPPFCLAAGAASTLYGLVQLS